MGKIVGISQGKFKSPEYIYAKIKRQWKSFNSANLLDDSEFPTYTAEVLKGIGNSAFREENAILFVKDGKAILPKDFKYIHAAYKCIPDGNCANDTQTAHLQNKTVFTTKTFDAFSCKSECDIECDDTKLISRVTIKTYVNDSPVSTTYRTPYLLTISPNARQHCTKNCKNIHASCYDEITINNGCIFTNFKDGDIFLEYYAFPFDEQGQIEIPAENPALDKAIEWFIKWQLLLNWWFTDEVKDMQQKWGKAEQLYLDAMAEAKFDAKLPSFSKLTDSIRNKRSINLISFFSQNIG